MTKFQFNGVKISILLLITILNVCSKIDGQNYRVMTYNIRFDNPNDMNDSWANQRAALVDVEKKYHPDIIGTQEGLFHQLEYIRMHLGPYGYAGAGRDDGLQKGEYAAIFFDTTRFELLDQNTFWLSQTPQKISIGWDAAMERICTKVTLKCRFGGDTLIVYNAHFDHIGEIARQKSAELIVSTIASSESESAKLILTGDFNAGPESKTIQILKTGLNTPSANDISGPRGTFNGFDESKTPEVAIDFLFAKNLKLINCQHIADKRSDGSWPSDHLPVMAEIKR